MQHFRLPRMDLLVFALGIWALLTVFPGGARAQGLDVGDRLPGQSFVDQFDAARALAACRRLLLFAPDRESAQLVNGVLAESDSAPLQSGEICFVADISGMPSLVTRMFALPAMRDYAYPVMLGKDKTETVRLPRQAEQATVLLLRDGQVAEVRFVAEASELQALLQP